MEDANDGEQALLALYRQQRERRPTNERYASTLATC